ncbi:MAG TPA: signal peptidase I [candidate division Zixibacteria bacterium]|nr:signal peptidase I [candidate division Zixibacteria bacterium]MDD4916180.1 signal peptidase I [candidate division Zixibacteria bacterium]MDM7972347.1 signal peptidase I [candidate division Zixibacteria bacterium]HOD67252.1 signal peptidase I [candidate division Zixibacteria bacterium]HPM37485.1 signal peptidase I [candidate division Zixibacteria bacterium]
MSKVWDNFKQVFLAVILAILIKTSIVEAYKIPSQSMEDTLLVGDFLLANKFVYGAHLPLVNWRLPALHRPEAGDVVIFIYPRDGVTKYIKRCVAVGGDTVEVRNKALYVNGKPFPDPEHGKYIDTTARGEQVVQPRRPGGMDSRDNFGPFIVPPDSYFMMGDNRDNSHDSRWWGAVHYRFILGEAMVIHWSWNDQAYPSPEVALTDPLSVPRVFLFNAAHFFQKVRWHRLFRTIS